MERKSAGDHRGSCRSFGPKSLTVLCVGIAVLIGVAPARAVTIGQLAPGNPPSSICGYQHLDTVQTNVTSGSPYVVPPFGATIVSWSTNAGPATGSPQLDTFKVYRRVGPGAYMIVGHDGPRELADGTVNSFPISISVQPGDQIGLYWDAGPFSTACEFVADSADDFSEHSGSLAD